MSSPSTSSTTSVSDTQLSPNIFSLGTELLSEVQHIVGQSKVKAVRLSLGSHRIKEIKVNPATAIATILIAVAAVVISNLRVEIVKE